MPVHRSYLKFGNQDPLKDKAGKPYRERPAEDPPKDEISFDTTQFQEKTPSSAEITFDTAQFDKKPVVETKEKSDETPKDKPSQEQSPEQNAPEFNCGLQAGSAKTREKSKEQYSQKAPNPNTDASYSVCRRTS